MCVSKGDRHTRFIAKYCSFISNGKSLITPELWQRDHSAPCRGCVPTGISGVKMSVMRTFCQHIFMWKIRVFSLLLSLLGYFNLTACFNTKHKMLLCVSVVWCFCRFSLDMCRLVVKIYLLFENSTWSNKNQFGITLFNVQNMINLCFSLGLSFHANGFQKTMKNLNTGSPSRPRFVCWKPVIVLFVVDIVYFVPAVSGFIYTGQALDYAVFVNHQWSPVPFKNTAIFTYLVKIYYLQICPISNFLFAFFFVVLILAFYEKFHVLNTDIRDKLNSQDRDQASSILRNCQRNFQQLSDALEHFSSVCSFFLGFNILLWMILVCFTLFMIFTQTTNGHDLYLMVFLLELTVTLYCCCLLNNEVTAVAPVTLFHVSHDQPAEPTFWLSVVLSPQVRAARPVLLRLQLPGASPASLHQVSSSYCTSSFALCRVPVRVCWSVSKRYQGNVLTLYTSQGTCMSG